MQNGAMLVRRLCIFFTLYSFARFVLEFGMLNSGPLLGDVPPADESCRWPPKMVAYIKSENAFNLSICVRFSGDAIVKGKPEKRYQMSEIFDLEPSNETISFDELVNISKELQMKIRYPEIWNTYPQDVPFKQILASIKTGKPINFVPKFNVPLKILASSRRVCYNGSRHDIVIVVKNAVLGFIERKEFRKHMLDQRRRYPRLNVGYVFSLGVPRSYGGRHFNRYGNNITLGGRGGQQLELFDGKADTVMEKIRNEIKAYDDIVLADYEDTYFNLTLKTITNYRWMSAFCRGENVKLFITIDDDHRVNLSMVEEFLLRVPQNRRNYSEFGRIFTKFKAIRSTWSKLYLSRKDLPWDIMASFATGFAHLIGPAVVDDVAIASAFIKNDFPLEDAYLGMVFHRLGVKLNRETTMFNHGLFPSSPPVLVASKTFFEKNGLL